MASTTTYIADGTTQNYPIGLSYVARGDISVEVNGDPVLFTFVDDSNVQLPTIPTSGSTISVIRSTDISQPVVSFVNASTLLSEDLDSAVRQSLYAVQEMKDVQAEWVSFIQNNTGGSGGGGSDLPPLLSSNDNSFLVAHNSAWEMYTKDQTKTVLGIDPTKTIGTAAYVNTGTTAGCVPLYENFGSAAFLSTGNLIGNVVTHTLNGQLGSAAYYGVGTTPGYVVGLADMGGGVAGLPAVSGASLTGVLHNIDYVRAEERKGYASVGGAYSTANTWVRRVLNTKYADETGSAVVEANGSVTLPSGTWDFEASCCAKNIGNGLIRVTKYDGTTTEIVRSETVNTSGGALLKVSGRVTVGASWGIAIDVSGSSSNASTDALGDPQGNSTIGQNCYSTLICRRVR